MYPVKRFSRPARGTWKNRGPYFPPFCFSPIPSFTLFPSIPLFSLPVLSALCFSALFAAGGWKRWKLGRWVREGGKREGVWRECGVEGASDDRWIFRKGFQFYVRIVCPPPPSPPSFLLAREWTRVHALSIHYSHPSLLCSPVWTKENRIMPIFLVHRYLKFSVGRIIKPQSASSVKAAMRGGNTLESIIPGRINKNWTDGPIKHVKQPTLFH